MRRTVLGIVTAGIALAIGGGAGALIESATAEPAGSAAPPEADGRELCVGDFRQLASKLATGYAEVPVSSGIGQDGSLVSIFASPASGSWTLVTTRPEGQSCVVAVGEAWQISPPAVVQPRV